MQSLRWINEKNIKVKKRISFFLYCRCYNDDDDDDEQLPSGKNKSKRANDFKRWIHWWGRSIPSPRTIMQLMLTVNCERRQRVHINYVVKRGVEKFFLFQWTINYFISSFPRWISFFGSICHFNLKNNLQQLGVSR